MTTVNRRRGDPVQLGQKRDQRSRSLGSRRARVIHEIAIAFGAAISTACWPTCVKLTRRRQPKLPAVLKSQVRITKSSKEQDGYERHRDRCPSPEPIRRPEATVG